jgi:parallel beta-helix repeat protein
VQFYGDNPVTTSFAASKKVSNLTVTGCVAKSMSGAGFWGARGYNVTFAGNTAENCGDIGFDFEGTHNGTMSGNSALNCATAGFAVYFFCQNIVISGNVTESPAYFYGGITITGDGNAADYGFQNIVVSNNVVKTTSSKQVGLFHNGSVLAQLVVSSNQFVNTTINIRENSSQIRISDNILKCDYVGNFNGIIVLGAIHFDIVGNTFINNGGYVSTNKIYAAIYVVSSPPGSPNNLYYSVQNNRVLGWTYSFTDSYDGVAGYGYLANNLVTGTLNVRGSGGWIGTAVNNYSALNPSTAVNLTYF